jgi:hypothetical protein
MGKHRWVCVLVVAGAVAFGLRCGDDKGSGPEPELTLDVDSLVIEVSSSHRFEASFNGEKPDVYWYVNGKGGGDHSWGMITTDGLYIAPADQPSESVVIIEAKAVEDTTIKGLAKARIFKSAGVGLITVTPSSKTVGITDSVTFSSMVADCSSEDVVWSIEPSWGSPTSLGTIRSNGTYVAPLSARSGFIVMIKATGTGCDDKTGIARAAIPADIGGFKVELEDFTVAHNIIHPGIEVLSCSAASQSLAVVGLNEAGEYIEIPMTVLHPGTYTASVFYSANQGHVIDVRVSVEGCGHASQQEDFRLDRGTGIG